LIIVFSATFENCLFGYFCLNYCNLGYFLIIVFLAIFSNPFSRKGWKVLAPTKEEHNDRGSKHLQEARPMPLVYRSVAKHYAHNEVSEGQTTVSKNVAVQLCKCKEVYVGKSRKKEELPPIEIEYVVGGRVRVSDNDGTQLGIYNGAMGTIHSFGCKDSRMTYHSLNPTNESIVDLSISQRDGIIIFVQMDKMALSTKFKQNGERLEYSCCDVVERLVPFAMKPSDVIINLPGIGKYRRFQYPLLPAQACTIHKSQGMTTCLTIFELLSFWISYFVKYCLYGNFLIIVFLAIF